jgi:hypothetical protein
MFVPQDRKSARALGRSCQIILRIVSSPLQESALERLVLCVERLRTCPIKALLDPVYVADCIRFAGLVNDSRNLYGADNIYMSSDEQGLWQLPTQLAPCLIDLAHKNIESILEVGTWSGWTISFITAYLLRFNPNLHAVTIDIGDGFRAYEKIDHSLPIEFAITTSAQYSRQIFDLAIIDGDHNYWAARADYDYVGRRAKICLFHDINDRYVRDYPGNDGGTPRLWRELSLSLRYHHFKTYIHHSENDSIMGIGIIERYALRDYFRLPTLWLRNLSKH